MQTEKLNYRQENVYDKMRWRTGKTNLKYPLIVKPDHEGSSLSITEESVVYNELDLRNGLHKIFEIFNQPFLVEEFIIGREFTIGVMGNHDPEVIDIRVDKDRKPYFLEINTLPGMQPDYSDFPRVAKAGGYTYESLVQKLLDLSLSKNKEN